MNVTQSSPCTFDTFYAAVATLDNVSEINYAILKAPSFRPNYVESFHKVSVALSYTSYSLHQCMHA